MNDSIESLKREIKELKKRPQFFIMEKQSNKHLAVAGTREKRITDLIPGEKYLLKVVSDKGSYEFHTPMMLVETPEVYVTTVDCHNCSKDDLIAIRINCND